MNSLLFHPFPFAIVINFPCALLYFPHCCLCNSLLLLYSWTAQFPPSTIPQSHPESLRGDTKKPPEAKKNPQRNVSTTRFFQYLRWSVRRPAHFKHIRKSQTKGTRFSWSVFTPGWQSQETEKPTVDRVSCPGPIGGRIASLLHFMYWLRGGFQITFFAGPAKAVRCPARRNQTWERECFFQLPALKKKIKAVCAVKDDSRLLLLFMAIFCFRADTWVVGKLRNFPDDGSLWTRGVHYGRRAAFVDNWWLGI